jgi:cytoskeletal protein CcmA (bactofilin family)
MFNSKSKPEMSNEKSNGVNGGATLISAGTTLKGDINSNSDLRIDGTIIGNIRSSSKIIIGTSGMVDGDIECNQADITGKVNGNIKAKDLLQLKGECNITGNVQAGKLQVEPTATFNGECHMGALTSSSKVFQVEEEEFELAR